MVTIFHNVRICTPDTILENHELWLQDGKIEAIVAAGGFGQRAEVDDAGHLPRPASAKVVDCQGMLAMPGMIDIHSDMIEGVISPRRGATMDYRFALLQAERELISEGITTMFHSISLYNPERGRHIRNDVRYPENAYRFAKIVEQFRSEEHLIKHRFHMRYEVDNLVTMPLAMQMFDERVIDLFSFMDHSPGQGQYHDLTRHRKMHAALNDEEYGDLIEMHRTKKRLSQEQMQEMAAKALEQNIAIASHDDDTLAKLQNNATFGTRISEFPITLEIAREARKLGYDVCVGAPNVLMGGSHVGNLSSTEAILDGSANILVSDYFTAGLLEAVFILHREHGLSLPHAINLVTVNPARAVNLEQETGSLRVGLAADVLLVQDQVDHPYVVSSYVNGIESVHYACCGAHFGVQCGVQRDAQRETLEGSLQP